LIFIRADGGQTILFIDRPVATGKLVDEINELSRLTRVKVVHDWDMLTGISVKYALSLGKPGLGVEGGGGGFSREIEEEWLKQTDQAVANIMKHMGMIKGGPSPANQQILIAERAGLWPRNGGYRIRAEKPEMLGEEIGEEHLLGTAINRQNLEVIDEMKAPYDGILYSVRSRGSIAIGQWSWSARKQAQNGLAKSRLRTVSRESQ